MNCPSKKTFSPPPPMVIPLENCPAKMTKNNTPGMPLLEHSWAVMYVAMELFRRITDFQREFILPDYRVLAFLHDMGKCSPGFLKKRLFRKWLGFAQAYPDLYNDAREFEQWHAIVSEAVLAKFCQSVARQHILGVHHGQRNVNVLPPDSESYGGEPWEKQRERLVEMSKKYGTLGNEPVLDLKRDATAALVCFADWIASGYFPEAGGMTEKEIQLHARKVVADLGWNDTPAFRFGLDFEQVFGFSPNAMQKIIGESIKGEGVYIIEASTGEGKTEAAFFANYQFIQKNHRCDAGMYFGLPTRLTSNRMYERVMKYLEAACDYGKSPRLIHGESWMTDKKSSMVLEASNPWFDPNRRALLEPYGVGTADQAVLAVVQSYFYFIRKFALIGKFVILDEIHTYDAHTSTLLAELIKELRKLHCVVVILSATLTIEAKARFLGCDLENIPEQLKSQEYPLLTSLVGNRLSVKKLGKRRSRRVHIKHIRNRDAALESAVDECAKGTNVVWIENTVNEAVATYCRLRNIMQAKGVDKPCGLLHSNFLRLRRAAIENWWVPRLEKPKENSPIRPCGSILVSTQIVEQSLDIDCDLLITNLAPSDFLFQRIGRLWRHSKTKRPAHLKRAEAWIILPEDQQTKSEKDFTEACGKSGLVYDRYTMWHTCRIWSRKKSVLIPDEVRPILERTYRMPAKNEPRWAKELGNKRMSAKSLLAYEARIKMATNENFREEMAFVDDAIDTPHESGSLTRRGSVPTKQLILCRRVTKPSDDLLILELRSGKTVKIEADKRLDREDAKEILFNTVRVVETSTLRHARDFTGELLKDAVFGFPWAVELDDDDQIWCCPPVPTEYAYTDELGAHRRVF